MGSYRPPAQSYGPPPTQDPYARPSSTTYNQVPPRAHGYGSPATTSSPWNVPQNQQYNASQYSNPLPPPPPGAPPANANPYTPYQGQTGGAYGRPPSLPPRVSQPYGQPTSTPPPPNPNQQAYQAPVYGVAQQPGHQRLPSVPSAYHEGVSQNNQGYPQHPQYSNQPPSHHYDPPLPPRPSSQGIPKVGGQQFNTYVPPQSQQGPTVETSQYSSTPGQPPYQQHGSGQNYDPSPSSSSVYSPDDPSNPHYQQPGYQSAGGYVPPPPPPKPQQYDPQPVAPGMTRNDAQPPRPSSVQNSYQQQYQTPPPPANAGYNANNSGPQYDYYKNNPVSAPYAPPAPSTSGQAQQGLPYGTSTEQGDQHGYGRQTPSQQPPRPYSTQSQHGYTRPPQSSEDPVSPLQGGQSISFDRPTSGMHTTAGAPPIVEQTVPKPAMLKPARSFAFSSDWEHFGEGADEIDDTAMYGVKVDDRENRLATVELPASVPPHTRTGSEVSAPESFHPSPAVAPAAGLQHPGPSPTPPSNYVPTPPTGPASRQSYQQPPPPAGQSTIMDEGDYIPPMPDTPPAVQRPARAPIVLGGSLSSQQVPAAAPSFVMDGGAYSVPQPAAYAMRQAMQAHDRAGTPQQPAQAAAVPPPAPFGSNYATEDSNWHQGNTAQSSLAAVPSPQFPSISPAELKKVQQEVEDLKAELGQTERARATARSEIVEKDSLIAQRDSTIMEKDALITQKDSEITQRTTHLNELQASLTEITETFGVLKASTLGLETQVKSAEAAQSDLKAKLDQSDTALAAANKARADEKKDLDRRLKEAQAGLAAAFLEVGELKMKLEEEKAKAEAKAAEPADIAPGLDSWFKGSLERYKEMLYTESKPIPVQEKIQLFMDFVNAETRLRGIDMPFGPKGEVKGFSVPQAHPQPVAPQRQAAPKPERPRVAPLKSTETDGFVMVDSDADVQYSPGGRPILNPPVEDYSPGGRPILTHSRTTKGPEQALQPQRSESIPNTAPGHGAPKPAYQPFRVDTPGSNQPSRGPSPAQPAAAPPKPAYQPFSWKQGEASVSAPTAPQAPPQGPVAEPTQVPAYKPLYKPALGPVNAMAVDASRQPGNSDILLDHVPGMKVGPKKDSAKGLQDEIMLPMPLKARTPAPLSTPSATPAELPAAMTPKDITPPVVVGAKDALERLASLVQGSVQRKQSKRARDIEEALNALNAEYTFIKPLTKTWEDKATVTRSRLEKERAKRQAELEKRNNELFDSGEIGYGDFETLEGQAKEEELRAKAEEDAEEYTSYSQEVFDVVFKRCQDDIRALARLQSDVEALLRKSGAGAKAVSNNNEKDDSMSHGMVLMLKIHGMMDATQAEIVRAVQERDRRYKLTQTKPLYAKGDIAGMKRAEKAFEEAEKKADVRVRVERAERCKRIWKIMDAEMERGAGENEDFSADIIGAVEDAAANVHDADKGEMLSLIESAAQLVGAVYEDTMALMRTFEQVDMQLNECEYDVSVASAKLKGDAKEYFERLEMEKKREDEKLREDAEKRLSAVGEHRKEVEGLLKQVLGRVRESAEEKEVRLRKDRALEEARRRNGEV